MTSTTFQASREVNQISHLLARFHCLSKLRYLLNSLLDTHIAAANWRRNHLGYSIDFSIGHLERASHIFNCGTGRQSSKRHDLAN